MPVVVGALRAVDNGPTLDRHSPLVGLHVLVRQDAVDHHREIDLHHVTGRPLAPDHGIAAGCARADSLAVETDAVVSSGHWNVAVQVAGHGASLDPPRNADAKLKTARLAGIDGDLDLPVPGIAGFLRQLHFAAVSGHASAAANEEVDVDGVIAHGVDVPGDGRDETHDVDGTTGAAEPGIAHRAALVELVLAVAGKRVGIEEAVAAEGDAREKPVVDDTFENVDVLAIAVQQKHAVIEEGVGNGGAGLEIGGLVREFVVLAEGFAMPAGADAAREVHLLRNDVVPDAVYGFQIVLVTRQRRDVRHAGIQVARANGVSDGLVLFDHRHMVLAVVAVDLALVAASAHVDEELRLLEVLGITRHAIELDQAYLDFLMSGNVYALSLALTEHFAHEVGILDRHVEERAFARSTEMLDGSFVHVSDVVELMTAAQVRPAPLLAGILVLGVVDRTRRVEVAVLLLRRRDLGNQIVEVLVQLGVGMDCQCVGRPLDHLHDVGVVEEDPLEAAFLQPARHLEVGDATGFLALLEIVANGYLAIRLEPRRPERVVYLHVGKRHGLDGIIALRCSGGDGE